MKLTTHLRCSVGAIAAFLAHPKYRSNKTLIDEEKILILGSHARWAYIFHLTKEEALEVISSCLPEIIKRQQPTGMWKRKNTNI